MRGLRARGARARPGGGTGGHFVAMVSGWRQRRCFGTPDGRPPVLARSKALFGGGNPPTANGAAARALGELGGLAGESRYPRASARAFDAFAGLASGNPCSQKHVLLAIRRRVSGAPRRQRRASAPWPCGGSRTANSRPPNARKARSDPGENGVCLRGDGRVSNARPGGRDDAPSGAAVIAFEKTSEACDANRCLPPLRRQ